MQIFVHFFCVCGIFFVPLQQEMKKIGLILFGIGICIGASAQTHTRVWDEQIRTLRVERRVLMLEDGVVDGSDPENTLHISFDEMSHDVHFYTYTVRLMNKPNPDPSLKGRENNSAMRR